MFHLHKKTEIIKEHFKLLFAAASFFVHSFIFLWIYMQKVPNKKNITQKGSISKVSKQVNWWDMKRDIQVYKAHRFIGAVDPPQLHNKRFSGSRVTRSSSLHPHDGSDGSLLEIYGKFKQNFLSEWGTRLSHIRNWSLKCKSICCFFSKHLTSLKSINRLSRGCGRLCAMLQDEIEFRYTTLAQDWELPDQREGRNSYCEFNKCTCYAISSKQGCY